MMIPINIQCGCGQHYEFEVEPVDGRMPSTVACPACGADGTTAANEVIARSTAAPPAAVAGSRLRLRAAAPSVAPTNLPPDVAARVAKLERPQAEIQARAKISWGDPPEEVIKFLVFQGINREDAEGMVGEMVRDRKATIRKKGVGKIVIGAILVLVPIVAWCVFASIGITYVNLLAIAIVIGLWGAWMILSGSFMLLSPKTERGDVAEQ